MPVPLLVAVPVATGMLGGAGLAAWQFQPWRYFRRGKPTLSYAQNARRMPDPVEAAVLDLLARADVNSKVLVTSTVREPEDQARIMLRNIKRHGVAYNERMYADTGDKVVRYIGQQIAADHSDGVIISNTAGYIRTLTASGQIVSRHLRNSQFYAVDLAPSSMDPWAVKRATSLAIADDRFRQALSPYTKPKDPALHLEVRL